MEIQIDKKLFEEWLKTKKLRERSRFEYLTCFDMFNFNRFDQENINEFLNNKNNSYVSRAFINNIFKFIKRTSTYSDEVKEFVNSLYVESITGSKASKKLRAITEKEMRELSQNMSIRNKLILYISFYCGLRRSELFGDKYNDYIKPLSFEHFNIEKWHKNPDEDAELNVVGKREKERTIPVPAALMRMIYQYGIQNRMKRNERLFNIDESRWAKILAKKGKEILGIDKLHPHELRSSCAIWLFIVKKKDIVEVMEILGHDNINTTQIYLNLSVKMRKNYLL